MGKKLYYCGNSKYRSTILAIATTLVITACSNSIQSDSPITSESSVDTNELNIWWEQGYNLEEDEAFRTIVNDWQELTGNKVNLSFFSNNELTAKAQRAVKAGHPADLMMTLKGERILYPRLAWEGELENVDDIIKPLEDHYADEILQGITYSNAKDNNRSYYGVPIYQATIFIYYWQQLLDSVDLKAQDIPQDWDDFWQFWLQAQEQLKTEQNKDIYALGLSLSQDKSADDTHYLFEQILEAYDIAILDREGNININAQVRQGIIDCLNWYSQFYQQGYIPPDAVQWSNVDNNRNLLNRLILMTPNVTLSIPATVRQDRDIYYNQLGITEFPNKPSGKPMRYLLSIKQAVIFKDSQHKSLAKDFLRYLIQPKNVLDYLKATGSRHQPVQTFMWSDPFWQDTEDPYITTATKILTTGQTRLSYVVNNPAYSQVLAENIWGQALTQVTTNQASPEQAADEAISKIQRIFQEWEKIKFTK